MDTGQQELALDAIRKKLVGKHLNYQEIYAIMDQIAKERLGNILTTYFVASGYSNGFNNEELFFLTKAMVETGEKLEFKGIVADKHSIGGVPGTRTTLIVVPIVAAAGFKIPKSSSRAITTPAGTADAMEVLSPVTFSKEEIYEIVRKANACIVWGGSFKIAPADDEIIKIEEPLSYESYDKILVSVMAKKIAFGSSHVVIDLPYGKTVKLHRISDAEHLAGKFEMLARKFDIKLKPIIGSVSEPASPGIGPLLEAKEALKVLEQAKDKSVHLEAKALSLAISLLQLCLSDSDEKLKITIKNEYGTVHNWAKFILESGKALKKFKEIIKAQKGNESITSSDLHPGAFSYVVCSTLKGNVSFVNNKNITILAKILGAPKHKKAGLFLHKRLKNTIKRGDMLFTLYSENKYNLKEAIDSLDMFPIYDVK